MTDIHSCSYYCDRTECIKAQRDELRSRLAQPECSHHFVRDEEAVKHYCCQKCGTVKVEQPEQEPVAWLDGPHLVVRLDMRNRLNYQGPWVDLGRAIPDKWTPFLYTAPPQRKEQA